METDSDESAVNRRRISTLTGTTTKNAALLLGLKDLHKYSSYSSLAGLNLEFLKLLDPPVPP
jgi:hypothetical protein